MKIDSSLLGRTIWLFAKWNANLIRVLKISASRFAKMMRAFGVWVFSALRCANYSIKLLKYDNNFNQTWSSKFRNPTIGSNRWIGSWDDCFFDERYQRIVVATVAAVNEQSIEPQNSVNSIDQGTQQNAPVAEQSVAASQFFSEEVIKIDGALKEINTGKYEMVLRPEMACEQFNPQPRLAPWRAW